jgi:hypothetical protein
MKSLLPAQSGLSKLRLYLIDNHQLPDGSWAYPIGAAYAAAVDALTMRVRVVDLGICQGRNSAYIRALFDSLLPQEVVWMSSVPKPFDHPIIDWQPYDYAQWVFPVLDRFTADHYNIKHAPVPPGWQLQIHCLPLGPEWFREYVADLRCRFPAYAAAVVFGLEACDYRHEAAEALAGLGMPWCACAGEGVLLQCRELMAHGMVGAIIASDAIALEPVLFAKLHGCVVHGTGFHPERALTLPLDGFTLVEKPAPAVPPPASNVCAVPVVQEVAA